jgi:CheY-like chemotaxis protein/phosphoribosyl 1,2-cyclic phosphodiesterase
MSETGPVGERRILVADDSPDTALYFVQSLKGHGYRIELATDGEECLATVRRQAPDLILLDLMMPRLHGIDVLRALRSDPALAAIGVIVCSAKGYPVDVAEARELGAYDFLEKPVPEDRLLAAVARYFAGEAPAAAPGPIQPPGPGAEPRFLPRLRAPRGLLRFWGTRGSTPVSGRGYVGHGGNTSCLELVCGSERLIVDAGTGIRDLGTELLAGPPRGLHLFIGHTHWDHIQGFPFFGPAYTPGYRITIYGAAGLRKDLRSIFAGQLDREYFPVQLEDMRAALEFRHLKENPVVVGPARVWWEYTQHPGSAVGFKLQLDDLSVGYITDNEFLKGYLGSPRTVDIESAVAAPYLPFIRFLADVDILVHEAQYLNEEYAAKVGWGHSSLSNTCLLARLTRARRLVVTHHDPTHDDARLAEKLALTRQVLHDLGSPIQVEHAYDGMVIHL